MNTSPGVLAINLLGIGFNNKYVISSCSHFVTDTFENWQDVPNSPVKVTVGMFGCFVLPFVLRVGIQ